MRSQKPGFHLDTGNFIINQFGKIIIFNYQKKQLFVFALAFYVGEITNYLNEKQQKQILEKQTYKQVRFLVRKNTRTPYCIFLIIQAKNIDFGKINI